MKRFSMLSLLALTMALLMLLTACAGDGDPVTTDPVGETGAESESETETETEAGSDTEADTSADTQAPTNDLDTYLIKDHPEKVNIQGRSFTYVTGVTSDWSASGIEFCASYEGELMVTAKTGSNAEYRVFIDGEETGTLTLTAWYDKDYTIPGSAEKAGENRVIRLVRITNVESGNTGILTMFSQIRLKGTLHEWTEERKLIEFVGDSITCGCGLVNTTNAFDGSKTYAYRLASLLGTDYSMVSVSGIGVSASTGRHNGRTINTHYGLTNWYRDRDRTYTPERQADIVVVNLNTNDNSNGATEAKYKEDAKTLIASIRAMHGEDVKIVWVVGHMIDATATVNGWLANVYKELGGEAAGLYTVTVTKNTSGGAYHPNQSSHDAVAEALKDFITQKGWLTAE